MKIKIEFSLDNAAFQDNPFEMQDILDDISDRLDFYCDDSVYKILDSNGNTIGYWSTEND